MEAIVSYKRIKQDIEKTIFKCLELLNLKIKPKKVLLKPNLTIGGKPGSGVATNVNTLKAIIRWLEEQGKTAYVAEGSGGESTKDAFKNSLYNKLGVGLIDLNEDKFVEVRIKNALEWKKIKIAKTFLDAKYVINIPVPKCHSLAGTTLGIKNLMGVMEPEPKTGWNKYLIHKEYTLGLTEDRYAKRLFERRLIDLLRVKKINLTIIDGTYGMEKCEVGGNPVKTDFFMASEDIIAVDIFCSKLMGFDPKKIYYLELAQKLLGKREIKIVGDAPKKFNFEKPKSWLSMI